MDEDKHYEFMTKDVIEFQHMQTVLMAQGIQFYTRFIDALPLKPIYEVIFDVPEYRLPFEFCYMVN